MPPVRTTIWQPQFTLHFVDARTREARARAFGRCRCLPIRTIHELRRLVVHRHSAQTQSAPIARDPRRALRAGHRLDPVLSARSSMSASAVAGKRSAAPPVASAVTTAVVAHLRRNFSERFSVERRRFWRNDPARPFARRVEPRVRDARPGRVPHATGPQLISRQERHATAPHTPAPHAPRLVWRTAPRQEEHTSGETRPDDPTPALLRTPAGAADRHEVAGAVTPTARATAPHISDLDPRLVDRLTEDVIRRVERRVRIERERRGM